MSENSRLRFDDQYHAITEAAGYAVLSDLTLIEFSGGDRTAFLHNLSTNDVRSLSTGQGCELFLTDVKGKTIGHGVVLIGPDSIILVTVAGQCDRLTSHFDRYVISEDVRVTDLSTSWQQIILAGPNAAETIQQLGGELPEHLFEHRDCDLASVSTNICLSDFFGPTGYVLRCTPADLDTLSASLAEQAMECGSATLEALRIESATPCFGIDFDDENLPQEIDRNDRAISFTKGCYLGQETIARIDAMGHVNKKLKTLRFGGDKVPFVGTELRAGKNVVGQVSSATWSPKWNRPIAMAALKSGHWKTGELLESDFGQADVL